MALATALPPYRVKQSDAASKNSEMLNLTGAEKDKIDTLYQNSAIQTRHTVLSDYLKPRSEWTFFDPDYPKSIPGTEKRNNIYKEYAPKLAKEVALKAVHNWGKDPKEITHVISVSCTGVVAPGIEFDLIEGLGLNPDVFRLGINMMGCFGAFKALAVASAFAKENSKHRVLIVCTELCSLHFQANMDMETLTSNALFSDGAAAAIVGGQPHKDEKPLWAICRSHSLGLANSRDKMSWEVADHGFRMGLSIRVPSLLRKNIHNFVKDIVGPMVSIDDYDWAIHPGGKSILQAIEKAMGLSRLHTEASWETLDNYGNMSSATFIFVLENLSRKNNGREHTLGLGFGPGLSIEGILLRKGS